MIKHIYKIVGLIVIFVAALFFFGSRMSTNLVETSEKTEMKSETFPYMTVTTQGEELNVLYGYSESTAYNVIRESITPLNQSKTIDLNLSDGQDSLREMDYRILDRETGEVYEEGNIGALTQEEKKVSITFDYGFKTSTEYILDIVGKAMSGREIHYFTRLKYYIEDSFLDEKLAFAKKFHKATFNKTKKDYVERYLEPSPKNLNASLAQVDITSSADLILYSNMSPKVISREFVTVKEYNMETACIQYNYFIQASTSSGDEIFHVKEFYRVRYASGHSYLLNFDRTMEAEFDSSLASTSTSQLKIGITEDHQGGLLANQDNTILFFQRNGRVYQYDLTTNILTLVYSNFSPEASYDYQAYNENDIRLLKVDEEGNLFFTAYGYFARGDYEGDVAVVLFEYTSGGELKEMVYMPTDTTFQQLKEDFATYGYV
nr:hypothetical protein [Eubacterium sp.]